MAKAQITLTPSESKRLIAMAVARLPEVRKALRNGIVVVCLGTTNAFVAGELCGKPVDPSRFAAGVVLPRGTCVIPKERRMKEFVFVKGKLVEIGLDDVLPKLGASDVVVKGANALDPSWTAGVFLASETGGTVGKILGVVSARGTRLIVPVSLEKFIPHLIKDVAPETGISAFDYSTGVPVGLIPLPGRVVTEIEAVKILTGADAKVMGAGGVSGAEGSVTLLISGSRGQIAKLRKVVEEIKGKVRFPEIAVNCEECKQKTCGRKRAERKSRG